MLCMLGKNWSRRQFEIFFLFSQKIGFDFSCKLSQRTGLSQRRQSGWNIKAYFLGIIRKISPICPLVNLSREWWSLTEIIHLFVGKITLKFSSYILLLLRILVITPTLTLFDDIYMLIGQPLLHLRHFTKYSGWLVNCYWIVSPLSFMIFISYLLNNEEKQMSWALNKSCWRLNC